MTQILCAIYVRLSKEDEDKQRLESESIQNQKALLTRYAAERGWDIFQIYCDEDYSGADRLRPDFNRMLRAAREKRFQVVLCKTQSRFTRDMELVEKYIHGLFPLWGVRFVAVADNADTEVRGNKKARQINGLVNEWYLEDLSENVRMVLDEKRREGRYIGGSPLYGYLKDPADKNRLVIDPEAARVVRQIFQWSLEGCGKQRIASMLNERGVPNPARYKAERGWTGRRGKDDSGLWNKTTIWRMLRNEMYAGVMVQGRRKKVSYKSKTVVDVPREEWYRVEGTHEAVIDRETFEAVQRGLDRHVRTGGAGEAHWLAGRVRCMDCGGAMSKTSNGTAAYLRCGLYAVSGSRKLCSRHSIRLDRLTDLVAERLRHYLRVYCEPGRRAPGPGADGEKEVLEREKTRLTARLELREKALKTLYLDRASGALGEEQFLELNRTFLAERGCLERRLSQVEAELSGRCAGQEASRGRGLIQMERVPRELAALLIERVEIGERDPATGRQEVKIYWNF